MSDENLDRKKPGQKFVYSAFSEGEHWHGCSFR